MKKKNFFRLLLSVLFVTIFFSACQKEQDPCDSIACLNGGTCLTGTCSCPPGYSGATCQIHDACYGITCLNGGSCANGICNCPSGYSGSDCSVVLTPISVTITSMEVISYPVTKSNGSGWDLTSGPDVFVTINSGTSPNQSSFVSGFTYTNATSNNLPFNTGFPVTLTSPNTNYIIGLWDDDSPASDELMAGVYFIPNDYDYNFPSYIIVTSATMSAKLYVTWNF